MVYGQNIKKKYSTYYHHTISITISHISVELKNQAIFSGVQELTSRDDQVRRYRNVVLAIGLT